VPLQPAADIPPPVITADSSPVNAPVDLGASGLDCLEPRAYSDGNGGLIPYCAAVQICGSERVDDIVSGQINNEGPGHYAAFLTETIGHINNGTFNTIAGFEDVSAVNQLLNENGLTDPEDRDQIPVFNFCGRSTDGLSIQTYDFTSITFDWTLDAPDIYDTGPIGNDLFEKLKTRINLHNPQIGSVPDTGYTFVNWPTWLYLKNLLPEEAVYTTNDTDTFRIDLRAILLRLDWTHGDKLIASCTAEQITIWDPDKHHPIDDLPDCHHWFNTAAIDDLNVEIIYRIEEDIRTAPSSGAYPPLQWTNFLGVETLINLDATITDYRIREIYAINTADGITQDDLRATYTTTNND
jgi:hypothetical protein